jgi:sterol desaturase/sphingolipid hydroxylase (fatty acid hydroxylase superfamily)
MTPTPWATYSFSSFEAIVNCPLWVLFFTFPAHPLAMIIGLFAQNIYNTFGHLGYEFFPKWMLRNKYICTVQATPTHHDAHHRYLQGNFGHYYNIWDFLTKTELKQYKPLRESVYEQLSNSPTAKPGGQPQSTGPT